jgi:hypothetical protein
MTQIHTGATTLNTPLHAIIRNALIGAYDNDFNKGKSIDPFVIESQVANVANAVQEALDEGEPTAFEVAIEAIETERAYQDAGCGNASAVPGIDGGEPTTPMSPEACLLCIEELTATARKVWYKPGGSQAVQHFFRKIGGVAVQALERYGAPHRELNAQQDRAVRNHQVREVIQDRLQTAFGEIFKTAADSNEDAESFRPRGSSR